MTTYQAIYDSVKEYISVRYGFTIEEKGLKPGETGTMDGVNLWIDPAQNPTAEQKLYILCHIFGHSVQWNYDDNARRIGFEYSVKDIYSDEKIAEIREYEQNASRLALQMLNDAGHTGLEQWISNWFVSDFAWLEHLYKTKEKLPYGSTWQSAKEALTPLAIPHFIPQQFKKRSAFA